MCNTHCGHVRHPTALLRPVRYAQPRVRDNEGFCQPHLTAEEAEDCEGEALVSRLTPKLSSESLPSCPNTAVSPVSSGADGAAHYVSLYTLFLHSQTFLATVKNLMIFVLLLRII